MTYYISRDSIDYEITMIDEINSSDSTQFKYHSKVLTISPSINDYQLLSNIQQYINEYEGIDILGIIRIISLN